MFRQFPSAYTLSLKVCILFSFLVLYALPAHAALININTASHSELTTLTGIGDVKAQAIIDYRTTNGPFAVIEDIMNVSGIGTATFESIKNDITVGEANTQESQEPQEESEEGNTAQESSGGGGSIFIEDTKSISVDIDENRTVFVGADAVFDARVIGAVGDPIENARVMWAFGDGTRKEGQSVFHHFAFPGTYVVIADAASGSYSASDRIVVSAVPAKLAITEVTSDYIALKNNTEVEVDIGGWLLFSLGKQFQFPQNTVVLAGQEVLISNKRTGLSGADPSTVVLQYPNGLVATAYEYPLFIPSPRAASGGTIIDRPHGEVLPSLSEDDQLVLRENLITAPVVATEGESSFWLWVVGVFGIAAVGSGLVIYSRRKSHEYAVEEI